MKTKTILTRRILSLLLFTQQRQNGIAGKRRRKLPMARLVAAIVCTSLLVATGSASAQGFIPDCTLPFASIAKHRLIDDNCTARGNVPDPPLSANDSAHALQNLAKNNFCASGTPALVIFISFKRLQQKLDKRAPDAKSWAQVICQQAAVFFAASTRRVKAPPLAKGPL
jgi:hypothetical protein